MKSVVSSPELPGPGGPYSPAIRVGDLLFISGQLAIEPGTGTLVDADIAVGTRRIFENLRTLLAAADLTLAHVVKTTVFLADMNDFPRMNEAYREFFSEPYPARTTVQAARLPRDARIEIDAIAHF